MDGNRAWTLAKLDESQLRLVREAEKTLGPDYVLVFQPVDLKASGVRVADLNDSQMECLQRLEKRLGMAVVAYAKV